MHARGTGLGHTIFDELGRSFLGYRTELIAEAAVDTNAAERRGLHHDCLDSRCCNY